MKLFATAAAALLMGVANVPSTADAGGFAISIGSRNGGFTYSNGYSPYRTVGLRSGYYGGGYYGASPYGYRGYGGYRGGYRSHSPAIPHYHSNGRFHYGGHSRGHYDYHPPSLVPHGNHFDYVPGHYDYHRGRHH